MTLFKKYDHFPTKIYDYRPGLRSGARPAAEAPAGGEDPPPGEGGSGGEAGQSGAGGSGQGPPPPPSDSSEDSGRKGEKEKKVNLTCSWPQYLLNVTTM